jgi:hypothetical protein
MVWMIQGSILDEWVRYISLLQSVKTGSGAHLASYLMGIVGSFTTGKVASA